MASKPAPVIIEAAINGMTPKERNPNVPLTGEEMARDALACFEAGAAIVHTHLVDLTLDVEASVEGYRQAWTPVLATRPDALFYSTFRNFPSAEERSAHIWRLAEEGLTRMSYVDSGSTNTGGADADGIPVGNNVYTNTYEDCRYMFEHCAHHKLGPSVAVFEPGFLRVVLAWQRAGRLPAGALIKFYFGGGFNEQTGETSAITFGLPPTEISLDAYLAMLEGCPLPWAVAVLGGDVTGSGLAQAAIERGGHVRVGLEDYAGARAPTNVELVKEVVGIAERVGRPIASSKETAALLGL